MTRSRGSSVAAGLTMPGRVAREIAAPASELRDEAGRVRAVVAGAAAGQEVQLGAQPLDGATLGRHVAQRDGAAQVDQLARVDARDRRRAVDQRRQHAEAGGGLIELEDDARGEVAHDRGQAVAAHVERRRAAPDRAARRSPARPSRRPRTSAAAGRFCSQTPPSSVSPRRCSDRAPVVLAQHHARGHRGPHARVGRDGEAHLGRPAGPAASVSVATGRISSSEIATGTPSSWIRPAPARIRISPSSLVGGSTPRFAAPPPASSSVVRAQIHLLDLQPRRLGRVGEPARQRAAERRFAPVRLDQHAREPQPAFAAREPVADPRDRALGRRGAFFLRRRQGDRRRRDVLARAHPRRAVTLRLVFGRVEDHGRRHDPPRGPHAQHDLLGAGRLDGDGARARQRHPLRPQPRLAAPADRRQQGFEGRGGGGGGHGGPGC